MSKEQIVDIDAHALLRTIERGIQFGLSYEETRRRIYETVRQKRCARRKHCSRIGKTYYRYYADNLSFYVMCREKETENYIKIVIKTIIIERGRE